MGQIVDLLLAGRENAIPSKDLAKLAGLSSVRELQRLIARERATGAVILSTCESGGGYFLPACQDEIRAFVRTLDARAKNTNCALRSARAALKMGEKEAAPGDSSTQDGKLAKCQPKTR